MGRKKKEISLKTKNYKEEKAEIAASLLAVQHTIGALHAYHLLLGRISSYKNLLFDGSISAQYFDRLMGDLNMAFKEIKDKLDDQEERFGRIL